MVRQARAEITRDTVLTGAADVFLRLGYANASLSEIIAQSQVTKGALYFHFGSKEELARAVIDEGSRRLEEACRSVTDSRVPALEAAIGISYITVDLATTDRMVAAMFRLKHQIGDFRGTRENVIEGWGTTYRGLAERAVEQGDFIADANADEVGTLMIEAVVGVHMVAAATDSLDELPGRMERMWFFVLPSLVPESKLDYFREFAARRVLRFGA